MQTATLPSRDFRSTCHKNQMAGKILQQHKWCTVLARDETDWGSFANRRPFRCRGLESWPRSRVHLLKCGKHRVKCDSYQIQEMCNAKGQLLSWPSTPPECHSLAV